MLCHAIYDMLYHVRVGLSGPDLVRLCLGIDVWSTMIYYDTMSLCYVIMS